LITRGLFEAKEYRLLKIFALGAEVNILLLTPTDGTLAQRTPLAVSAGATSPPQP
jgi:hypothetical protein